MHALGIATQAWSPLGGVYVYASSGEGRNVLTDPVITELAAKYGKTPSAGRPAVAPRRWTLSHPEVRATRTDC